MKISGEKNERAWIPNLIVFVVVTVSMFAVPIRNLFRERNDPYTLAQVRGIAIAQAFDKAAITNRESAAAILRCVDPTLELATLSGTSETADSPTIAWSVADLPPGASRELPLLISRNVNADSLASFTGRVADALTDMPPFGTNCAVIIFRSGRSAIIQGDALNGTWSPYLGEHPAAIRLLHP